MAVTASASLLTASRPVLVFVHLLATCVWVGGFVAIAVVARIARRELEPPTRVAFFRGLGRSYGIVGGASLAVALGTGLALLSDRGWSGTVVAAAVLAAALVVATAAGVVQARGMTRRRERALRDSTDERLAARVDRGAVWARALRLAIGGLTLALLAVGATLASGAAPR